MVIVALIVAGVGVWGIARLPTSFIPDRRPGLRAGRRRSCPTAPPSGRTQQVMDQVTKIALGVPGVDQVIAISGISVLDNSATLANAGVAYVILKDWSVRKPGSGADLRSVYANLQGALDKLQDGVALVLVPPPIQGIGNASGFTMQVELRDGSFDYAKLQTITQTIVQDGNTQTGLQRLNSTFRAGVPQVRVVVDRVKAETLNVAVGDVFNVLAGYIGSSYVNQFNKFGRTFQVYVQADSKYPTAARRHRESLCAQPGQQDGAAGHAGDRYSRWSGLRWSACTICIRRRASWAVRPQGFSSGEAMNLMEQIADKTLAARRGVRVDRDVLSGEARRQPDHLCVRPGHAAGLSVPGRPVRKLDRADIGAACGAAVADGAGDRADQPRAVQQSLYPDRAGPADRAVGEERHPDRRGRARAAHAAERARSCRPRSMRRARGSGRS